MDTEHELIESTGDTELSENGKEEQEFTSLPPYISYYLKTITPLLMQHMHSEPVIQHLLKQGQLNLLDSHCLNTLFVSKQVEYLIDKLLLPGDLPTLRQFVEALRVSGYHVNLQLAQLVDVGFEQGTDTETITEEFLSSHEKDEIIEHFYQSFLEYGELADLIGYLESLQVIDDYHIGKITQLSQNNEKALYLFDEVLLRGTYQTIEGFRQALKMNDQHQVAQLLPQRNTQAECMYNMK